MLPDSKIKYSEFYSICVLMFMHYTVFYFTGIFYGVVRQMSALFVDNKDSVFSTIMIISTLISANGGEDGDNDADDVPEAGTTPPDYVDAAASI